MSTRKIRDLDPKETCTDPEHDPPMYMVFSPGVWEHTCPSCGKTVTFTIRNMKYVDRPVPWWPGNHQDYRRQRRPYVNDEVCASPGCGMAWHA
jgi:hypothetical protein